MSRTEGEKEKGEERRKKEERKIQYCQVSSRDDTDEEEDCGEDEEGEEEALRAGLCGLHGGLEGDARDMPVHPDAEHARLACFQWDGALIQSWEEAEILTLRAEDANPEGC